MPVKGVYYEVAFINHIESIFFYCAKCSCGLTNVGEQRGTYILKPLSMKGNLTAEKLKILGISLSVQTCKRRPTPLKFIF